MGVFSLPWPLHEATALQDSGCGSQVPLSEFPCISDLTEGTELPYINITNCFSPSSLSLTPNWGRAESYSFNSMWGGEGNDTGCHGNPKPLPCSGMDAFLASLLVKVEDP